ncbi:penicillin-binding transpeptidase domain-containing protein [Streptomyces sp. enrichment culture]|uniref:penicillin-binding transpeptidase domain-containing protein n=1 Tax=Streptomyces sp. enrichment culture TaxID=1795815 RepID=UPI003F54ABD9
MRKGVKGAVIGTVFTVMVGGAGYGAYNFVSALSGDGDSGPGATTSEKSGPPSEDEVAETTKAFFEAWEQGRGARAASFTNNAAAAEPVLTSFGGSAHLTDVQITAGTPQGTRVPFSVKATVSYKGRTKPLAYDSALKVVRGITTGRALVDWQPTVVHPELGEGDTLVTEESASPPIEAVARDGSVLTKDRYPSLGPVLDELRKRYGHEAGGTRGVELSIRHTKSGAADTSLLTITEGRAGRLPTTISPRAQAAAEKAVTAYKESSVVALKPSTGEILAVANNRADGWNAAFEGALAPGSTMKIVSAALLIDQGLTTADGPAPCPAQAVSDSATFHNLKGLAPNESATLADSFARSCNTAFVKFADEIQDDSLTREAQEKFGLGRDDWKAGVTTFDGSVPVSEGPDTAAALLGQGKVQMSPLNMASVTATAVTGTFRQPVIVPQSLDGRQLAQAQGLRPGTVDQLRAMMNRTATSGTAAEAMRSVPGGIGAKTGSAEVDGQATSNSWFTGFRDDMAAAAMAQQGGHGSDAAGPIVAQVLKAGG